MQTVGNYQTSNLVSSADNCEEETTKNSEGMPETKKTWTIPQPMTAHGPYLDPDSNK